MTRRPVFCRAFSETAWPAFSGVRGARLILGAAFPGGSSCSAFPGDCFSGRFVMSCFSGVFGVFFRFPGFPAAFCRGPHAAVGETLLGRKSFVNELSANRRYRKICYYESGGIVFLSYFIVFLVGAWSACRGRLLKKWVMTCVRSYFLLYRVCRVVIYCYLYTINIEITQKDTV